MNANDLFTLPSITLAGRVEPALVAVLDKQIKAMMEKKPEKALVILTTTGGMNAYSIGIYERLRLLQQVVDLTLVGIGIVYSAGITISMAFPKEKRWLTAESSMMFHQTQVEITPSNTSTSINLTARELLLAESAVSLEHQRRNLEWIFDRIAKGTGQKEKTIKKMAESGTYFTAKEALDFGLIGGILDEKKSR